MKNVYKLNLPQLDSVMRDDAKYLRDHHLTNVGSIYTSHIVCDIFKPEWQTFANFKWDTVLRFYIPSGGSLRTHSDSRGDDESSNHPWGINWIWGGSGTMRFWTLDNINTPIVNIDTQGYHTYVWKPDTEPNEIVNMDPGVYLVNAKPPHQPTSLGDRYCFSLRSSSNYNIPWEQIVERFQNYII